jgi:hypothetical protein
MYSQKPSYLPYGLARFAVFSKLFSQFVKDPVAYRIELFSDKVASSPGKGR